MDKGYTSVGIQKILCAPSRWHIRPKDTNHFKVYPVVRKDTDNVFMGILAITLDKNRQVTGSQQ